MEKIFTLKNLNLLQFDIPYKVYNNYIIHKLFKIIAQKTSSKKIEKKSR